jgi:drug/metabolite transporter (DMT)-like permease
MFYIITANLAWGFWAIAEKLALKEGNPVAVMLVTGLTYAACTPLFCALMTAQGGLVPMGHWTWWAALAAILGIVANLCFMSALHFQPTSVVTSWTQLYPLVTYAACFVFMGEKLTLEKLAGAGLMLAGAIVMNR